MTAAFAIAVIAFILILCGLSIIFTGDNNKNAPQVSFGALVAFCGLFLFAVAMCKIAEVF